MPQVDGYELILISEFDCMQNSIDTCIHTLASVVVDLNKRIAILNTKQYEEFSITKVEVIESNEN